MAMRIPKRCPETCASGETFSDFPPALDDALEQEAITTTYPIGAVLFAEGQAARGSFI